MKNKKIYVLVLLTIAAFSLQGSGLAGEFLNFGAGARSMGMGRSGTGLSDDASAPYYNPAGIYQVNPQELMFMHTVLFMGTSYDYLSYIHPTEDYGSIGLSFVQVRTSDVEDRDEINNYITNFGESEMAGIISYARDFNGFISLGMNYKLIYHSISHWSAVAQGLDAACLLFPNKPYSLGLMVKNLIKPSYALIEEENRYPTIFRFGGSYTTFDDKLIFASDMSWSNSREVMISGGLEYQFYRYASLRIGADENYISYGLGINIPLPRYTLKFDYSLQQHHESGGMISPSHNISMTVDFGGFRAKIHPDKSIFSPRAHGGENILWLQKEINTRAEVSKWQLIIKSSWGEVVRTFEAWGELPERLYWDGRDETGNLVQDGDYYYELVVTDETGRSYKSGGKLTTIKTTGPEGKLIFEEKWDTLGTDTLKTPVPEKVPEFEEMEREEESEKKPEQETEQETGESGSEEE